MSLEYRRKAVTVIAIKTKLHKIRMNSKLTPTTEKWKFFYTTSNGTNEKVTKKEKNEISSKNPKLFQ
jgi:hypothetical protein